MRHLLRHIAPVILLASYLPMAMTSSFHIHNDTVDEQDICRLCVGHYDKPHCHHHDCPYCNFLSLNYIVQPTFQIIPPQWEPATEPDLPNVTSLSYCYGTSLLRAPPTA
ncbi:MAG: hypothetical protein IKP34_03140 [Bacteroidales bacterium]|nr:hypothetical protein [Bacteroidales bacterium]